MKGWKAAGRHLRSGGFVAVLCSLVIQSVAGADETLVGHWPLMQDRKGLVGVGIEYSATGPRGAGGAAQMNGRDSRIEISDTPGRKLGTDDFTIAAWIETSETATDQFGDFLADYDSEARRGFTFGLSSGGITSSQPNRRQLYFAIDDGTKPAWTDRGRPGGVLIYALAVHEGNLYAGTCEPGVGQSGHVYRLDGAASWIDCGAPDLANSVSSLAVYQGKLYAGTSKYRLRGSALDESENPNTGGGVFVYEGGQQWRACGRLEGVQAINGMVVYEGKLYVSSTYSPGVFRYEGDSSWSAIGTPAGKRVESLTLHNGAIFGTAYDGGEVYRYNPAAGWSIVTSLPDVTQSYSLATWGGRLHVSTWPTGSVFRDDGEYWTDVGRLGTELEVMPLAAYGGALYAGTLPLAEVYRFDGPQRWASLGQIDKTPDVKYRRVWSMALYRGELYCGTLPSAGVHSLRVGQCVTSDRDIGDGWRHVAAVRRGRKLALFVDGAQVAESTLPPDSAALDISNDVPLMIGSGPADTFCGAMADVRIYHAALSAAKIAALFKSVPVAN